MTEEQIAINRLLCGNTAHSCKADYIKTAIKALEEVQKYKALGTVDELKALKEKSGPKKPIYKFEYPDGTRFFDCPVCGVYVMHLREQYEVKYCNNCGQRLNWNNTDS